MDLMGYGHLWNRREWKTLQKVQLSRSKPPQVLWSGLSLCAGLWWRVHCHICWIVMKSTLSHLLDYDEEYIVTFVGLWWRVHCHICWIVMKSTLSHLLDCDEEYIVTFVGLWWREHCRICWIVMKSTLSHLLDCDEESIVAFVGLWWRVHCHICWIVMKSTLSHLLDCDEEYIVAFPNGYGRTILTVPWIELGGSVTITCAKTGYSANSEDWLLRRPRLTQGCSAKWRRRRWSIRSNIWICKYLHRCIQITLVFIVVLRVYMNSYEMACFSMSLRTNAARESHREGIEIYWHLLVPGCLRLDGQSASRICLRLQVYIP
jgi:hypothetical protein